MKRTATLVAGLLGAATLTFAAGSAQATKLRHPLTTSHRVNFGLDHGGKDYNCGSRFYSGHRGNDFSVAFGSQVVASANGVVQTVIQGCADYGSVGSTCGGGCGNYIRIKHDDGMSTLYCHMKNGSIAVSVGQTVTCGQNLGLTASSGSSSGPHLHLAWRPPTGTDRDPYVGGCSGGESGWVQQNAYTDAPSATCECAAGTEICDGKDNDCDGAVDEDEVCERARFVDLPALYAPPSTTDIDGDGRADVCGRGLGGIACHRAGPDADTLGPEELLVPLSNANGWGDETNYATLRMGDVDGDGRADLCARSDARFQCWTSGEKPLGTSIEGPAWSDASGWGVSQHYATIRLLDVDGDGKEDVCARAAKGIVCHLSIGTGFGPEIAGPAWSNDAGFGAARFYGTLRTGDVDGDGKSDLCIRDSEGMTCALSTGNGFGAAFRGPAWSDKNGWGDQQFFGSIRLADVNGDGKADLCARSSAELACHFSEGKGFGPGVVVAPLSNASGWDDPGNLLTFRTGDVDRDGAADLCLRANDRVFCWAYHDGAFVRLDGPAFSDENGWNAPQHYETMRLGDLDGDGRLDVCARSSAGFTCARANGNGFGEAKLAGGFGNAIGWGEKPFYNTLLFASPACRPQPETCNQKDDDCDGAVDEDDVCVVPSTGGTGGATNVGGASSVGGAPSSGGRSGSGGVPMGSGASAGRAGQSGASGSAGRMGSNAGPSRISAGEETDAGGCGCRVLGTRATMFGERLVLVGLVSLLGAARVRRRSLRRATR